MSQYVADTHAIHWHIAGAQKLSATARHIFSRADDGYDRIIVPSVSVLELILHAERRRISWDVLERLVFLVSDPDGSYRIAPLDLAIIPVFRQIDRVIVPELPDRIVAATAVFFGLPLITRDYEIARVHGLTTIW